LHFLLSFLRFLPSFSMSNKRKENPVVESGVTTPSKCLHVRNLPAFASESDLVALATPFGVVVRTFILQGKNQAFVQMDSVESATALVTEYETKQCTIRQKPVWVQFSKRDEIKPTTAAAGPSRASSSSEQKSASSSQPTSSTQAPNSILIVSVLNARLVVTIENLYTIFKPYGDVLKIVMFVKGNVLKALVQMGTVDSAVNAQAALEGKDMFKNCCHLRIGFSSLTSLKVKNQSEKSRDFYQDGATTDFTAAYTTSAAVLQYNQVAPVTSPPVYAENKLVPSTSQDGPVLLVTKLADTITPDMLFTLFGVYGDVLRVKQLYNKRDNALIQFANSQQAFLAQLHLNHVGLCGKQMSIFMSKHSDIKVPREPAGGSTESAGLTKDYSNSPIHRFRQGGGKNARNIYPPSQVLHISNLPDGATEKELAELFGAEQTGSPTIQFFSTNRKMAYAKMDSISDAILALIRLHNHRLSDRFIRVSFSNKDPTSFAKMDEASD